MPETPPLGSGHLGTGQAGVVGWLKLNLVCSVASGCKHKRRGSAAALTTRIAAMYTSVHDASLRIAERARKSICDFWPPCRCAENFIAYCAGRGYVDGTDNLKSGSRLHLLHLFRRALMSRLLSWTAAFAVLLYSGFSRADTFGSGANSFDIDFVTVGTPGNPADANPNPAGAVPY